MSVVYSRGSVDILSLSNGHVSKVPAIRLAISIVTRTRDMAVRLIDSNKTQDNLYFNIKSGTRRLHLVSNVQLVIYKI